MCVSGDPANNHSWTQQPRPTTQVFRYTDNTVIIQSFLLSLYELTSCFCPESSCDGRPLDLIFVIDSSRSVRPDDFERVKSFIRDVLLFLDVARDQTRVGLVQFGSVVQNEFFLNSYFEKRQMERAVRSMEHLASGTMTGLALQFTREQAFSLARGARPAHTQVPRIAVVVTDDRPQDSVEEEAARAREDGIEIFAVGVGRVDMATLRAIGSEPHAEHVHLVSVFHSKLCAGQSVHFTL